MKAHGPIREAKCGVERCAYLPLFTKCRLVSEARMQGLYGEVPATRLTAHDRDDPSYAIQKSRRLFLELSER